MAKSRRYSGAVSPSTSFRSWPSGWDQVIRSYGMRSGNLMFGKKDHRVLVLARAYAEEILSLRLNGPIVLGGNCQGAHVAYHIARILIHKQHPPTLVFLMEASFDSGLAVPVALIYGKNSPQHNPFLLRDDPKPCWSQLYPDYSVDQISGGHGEYFNDQNLPDLLSVILKQLKRIDTTMLPRQQQAGLLAD